MEWLRWGYDHESFWDQTFRTLALTAKAQAERAREEFNKRQILAWHTAALQRAKQLPKLSTLLIEGEKPVKPKKQTVEEQMAIMEQLAADMRRKLGSPMKRMTDAGRGHT